jgi:predicted acetyltransferase
LGGAVAVAIIRRREEEVREDFHRAGALQPIDARSLADVGLEENFTVRRMMLRAVIREAAPGLFYFDEEVWQSVRRRRRRMAVLFLIVTALVLIVGAYAVTTFK